MIQKTPEMILMIGIPGSGKSTFCQRRYPGYCRISLDDLHTRHQENVALQATLTAGRNCVIDNTNVSAAERAKFIAAGKAANYRIVGYYLQSKIEDCLKRNAQREGKQRIPDAGIIGRATQLELPRHAEGFDELHYVKIEDNDFIICDWKEEQ